VSNPNHGNGILRCKKGQIQFAGFTLAVSDIFCKAHGF
jgi:hypothetical protein